MSKLKLLIVAIEPLATSNREKLHDKSITYNNYFHQVKNMLNHHSKLLLSTLLVLILNTGNAQLDYFLKIGLNRTLITENSLGGSFSGGNAGGVYRGYNNGINKLGYSVAGVIEISNFRQIAYRIGLGLEYNHFETATEERLSLMGKTFWRRDTNQTNKNLALNPSAAILYKLKKTKLGVGLFGHIGHENFGNQEETNTDFCYFPDYENTFEPVRLDPPVVEQTSLGSDLISQLGFQVFVNQQISESVHLGLELRHGITQVYFDGRLRIVELQVLYNRKSTEKSDINK